MESSKDAQHSDVLESKGCLANKTPSRQNKRTNFSSSDGTGPRLTESPGLPRVLTPSDTAAGLSQKTSSSSTSSSSSSSSSSAQSNPSSKVSLPEIQKEKYPEEFSLLKSQTKDGQRPEWTFYPRFSSNIHTYHVGKQCFFNGVFRGNRRSVAERTVDKSLGKKKYDIDPRNGIPKLTPGDNPYMFPEQSKEFFKAGATLPPVNFSLLPFWEKEKANNLKNEIKEVEDLENWQAPMSFLHSFFSTGTGEMAPRLKVLAALPEGTSSVLSTQGRLTTPCSSSIRGSQTLFLPHRTSSHVLRTHTRTLHINKKP
ncbi:spermatogenesis-associated serine-rich protein 1 isoform X2 [Grammomys surdaster]|uniref:spermatogenesis-associated serine-rich protein 1 isoform X2 n=1 Tax=Grammomys surdaster TaxID=491861 RepID=UPI00109FE6C4|nr:spermatogenesis-associated serine-rich protein 1 isoform X2 [Grammomys surdaster]